MGVSSMLNLVDVTAEAHDNGIGCTNDKVVFIAPFMSFEAKSPDTHKKTRYLIQRFTWNHLALCVPWEKATQDERDKSSHLFPEGPRKVTGGWLLDQ